MHKTIPIDQLKPGMFMVGIDQSWLKTPFFLHRRLINEENDIALLKQHGVRNVIIDPTRGTDVEDSPASVAAPAPAPASGIKPPVEPALGPAKLPAVLAAEMASSNLIRAEAVAAVQRVFEGIKTGAALDCSTLRSTVAALLDRLFTHQSSMTTIVLLQQMRHADQTLFDHAVDVSVLSLVVGKEHGLDMTTLDHLGVGALLHDIGQMRLPHNLLRKAGAYTPQEERLMRLHPELGIKMLANAGDLHDTCRRIVVEHHEFLDGTGYPYKIRGSQMSPLSQIVGLVDRYEALASSRGGRPAMFPAQAVRELYQLGVQQRYDRHLVERMIHCLGVYPVGSLVELNTGERGVVVTQNRSERLRPTIKLIWEGQGHPYSRPWILDLSASDPTREKRSIRCVLDPAQEQVNIAACIEDIAGAFDAAVREQGHSQHVSPACEAGT